MWDVQKFLEEHRGHRWEEVTNALHKEDFDTLSPQELIEIDRAVHVLSHEGIFSQARAIHEAVHKQFRDRRFQRVEGNTCVEMVVNRPFTTEEQFVIWRNTAWNYGHIGQDFREEALRALCLQLTWDIKFHPEKKARQFLANADLSLSELVELEHAFHDKRSYAPSKALSQELRTRISQLNLPWQDWLDISGNARWGELARDPL